jgi:hypothetical protein
MEFGRESPRVDDTKSGEKRAAQQQLYVVVRWFGGSKGLCAHPGMVQGLVDEAPMSGFGVICKVRRGRVSVDFCRSPPSREMPSRNG